LIATTGNVRLHGTSTGEIDGHRGRRRRSGIRHRSGPSRVNDMSTTTEASISGGVVTAHHNATVIAESDHHVFGIAGTISGGGTAGVGGSVTLNTFSNVTRAFISGGASVTGKGNGTVSVRSPTDRAGARSIRVSP